MAWVTSTKLVCKPSKSHKVTYLKYISFYKLKENIIYVNIGRHAFITKSQHGKWIRHETNEFSQNKNLTFFFVSFIMMCKIFFMRVIEKLNHITGNTWHISE